MFKSLQAIRQLNRRPYLTNMPLRMMSYQQKPTKDDKMMSKGVRADEQSGNDSKFDPLKDKSFRSLSLQLGVFFAIVFVSGKCVGYIVDNYLYDGASKLLPEQSSASKLDLIKGESVVKHLGLTNTFLTE